ncbi:MAG: 30S ribosomal protein S16 [Gemmatimonadales bacterium]|nr:30S ribosomal protein S16 [Gemmatimonadales bacterium]
MATRIRLRRVGRKKLPIYRIVVAEKTKPRDGRFIAILGTYNPRAETDKQLQIDVEAAKEWVGKGATPSDTVGTLLKKAGVTA